MKYKKIFFIILVIFTITIIGNIMLNKSSKGDIKVNIKSESGEIGVQVEKEEITVHIKGAVKSSGVVTLMKGLRVADALKMVGGTLEDADLDAVNLAAVLKDGQAVYIPHKGEKANNNEVTSGKININNANKEELIQLPGIGETIAEEIIKYRNENGYFASIEEITDVKRIGNKTFEKLKDLITIQ